MDSPTPLRTSAHGTAAIAVLTCFRPLSDGALAEAITRGAANPKWRDTRPGMSQGVPFTLHDPIWWAWMDYLRPNFFPPGCSSAWLRVFNRPTWDAYRLGVAQAKLIQARYLFVIEDDVYIPEHTLRRLYAVLEENPEAGAACGIYWWRRQPDDPDFPQLYHPATEGHPEGHGGPWLRYPQDQVVEVGAGGLGCMLIRMEALRKAEAFGELFLDDWEGVDGVRGHGGDLCVQHRLQQAGYRILADTSIRAWHRDPYMGVWYPHDAAVCAAYGWPEQPLNGFARDLGELPPGVLAQVGPKPAAAEDAEGRCSLCPLHAPMLRARDMAAHVAQVHPGAQYPSVPTHHVTPGIFITPTNGGTLKPPTLIVVSRSPTAAGSSPEIVPALNVGFGGYPTVHPDFCDGDPVFAWEYQDAYPHAGVTPDLVGDFLAGIPRPDGSYGFVYANHFLEHIDPARAGDFLRECWRLLRPGGRIYVACPDGGQVWPAFARAGHDLDAVAYTLRSDGSHPITFRQIIYGRQGWAGDEHRHMWDPMQIRAAFRDAGLPGPMVSTDAWCPLGLRAMAQKPRT